MGFLQSEENFFGVDIGNSAVRIVQLKGHHPKPNLLTYGDIEVPEGLVASDSLVDQEKLATIIKTIANDAGVSTKNVVTSLPTASVFTTIIKTPKLSHDELAHSIKYQADKYIPMPLDQVKIDWYSVGQSATNPEEMEVLLVAAPNVTANKYLNVVQKAGFELLALEINPIALTRSLLTNPGIAVVIVDFGANATDITIVSKQIPQLVRSVNVGSHALTRVTSQNLGLDKVQAEQFIRKFGLTQTKLEGQVFKALKPLLDNVIEEINKSVKYYQEANPSERIEKIVITGGTAALPELPVYLANSVGFTVEIGNPWANISYVADMQDKLSSISLNYATAVGLAMREG